MKTAEYFHAKRHYLMKHFFHEAIEAHRLDPSLVASIAKPIGKIMSVSDLW
jgi:hypothetical protein